MKILRVLQGQVSVSGVNFIVLLLTSPALIKLHRIWTSHSDDYEEYSDVAPNSVVEVHWYFRGTSSHAGTKKNWAEHSACCLLLAGSLLMLLFNPEDGANVFLWNSDGFLLDCMVLLSRRQYSELNLFVLNDQS